MSPDRIGDDRSGAHTQSGSMVAISHEGPVFDNKAGRDSFGFLSQVKSISIAPDGTKMVIALVLVILVIWLVSRSSNG